ncbi:MAG: hypothetical protein D6720_11330, partial [Gammaproteobacteria bacterium]
LLRAQEQCLLSAACQNMKKMALLAEKEAQKATDRAKKGLFAFMEGLKNRLCPDSSHLWPLAA